MEYSGQLDGHFLHGCFQEADRAKIVAHALDLLRASLGESFRDYILGLSDEIRRTATLLRDLLNRTNGCASRVPMIVPYLNVILPCISRSLRDITGFYEDRSLSKEVRWRKMYHQMTQEAGGIPLPQRFALYNSFLAVLLQLLTRNVNFDLNTLEKLKSRILDLREKRGIAPPAIVTAGPVIKQEMMMMPAPYESNVHWAQQIFSLPLPSRTTLKHSSSDLSISCGPYLPVGQLQWPSDSSTLFRRIFDNDRLCLAMYLNGFARVPHIMLRTYHQGSQWFTTKGTNEVCISRKRSAIELRRWSQNDHIPKLWTRLFFVTWEEMVLFFCTFVSLKARNPDTLNLHPGEYKLGGEKRLFMAQIIDDGFTHALLVFQDKDTGGTRLQAAVWDGQYQRTPVWTAFITHQSASPTWLVPKSKRRIWLKDIQLYVFCDDYRQQNQRPGRGGEFELQFASEKAAILFKKLFDNGPPGSSSNASSGSKDGGGS